MSSLAALTGEMTFGLPFSSIHQSLGLGFGFSHLTGDTGGPTVEDGLPGQLRRPLFLLLGSDDGEGPSPTMVHGLKLRRQELLQWRTRERARV